MPKYAAGDYIKVEFKNEDELVGEWMWVRVDWCDDAPQIVFGTFDNEPVMDSGGKLHVGSQLAISYDKIREHRKPTGFTLQ
jgi:hypothetical protein